MMDLIDRKALDDAFTDLRWGVDGNLGHWGDRPDWCLHGHEIERLIQSIPSVPAVPLDKLCEWLAERYEPPYSLIEIEKLKWPIDFRQQKEMWMVALTKWMEGLDAAD